MIFRLVFGDMRRFRALARLLRLYQQSGLQWLARATGLLRLLGLVVHRRAGDGHRVAVLTLGGVGIAAARQADPQLHVGQVHLVEASFSYLLEDLTNIRLRPERQGGALMDVGCYGIDLARFLASLYTIDPTGGPLPGSHNFFRGGDLRTYDKQTRQCIALLAEQVDARFATEVWEAALSTVSRPSSVWVHGDVAPSNLLVSRGRLSAVIDFGCSAVGDPACDLAMAWTFFVGKSRAVFRNALDFDDETWARGRAWAMWKALSTLAQSEMNRADPDVAAQRFGWRGGPRDVIDEVFADHASSG